MSEIIGLLDVCDPDALCRTDLTSSVWKTEIEGRAARVGTDGFVFVALWDDGETELNPFRELPERMKRFLDVETAPISLDALRRWAGPFEGPRPCKVCQPTCATCEGSGHVVRACDCCTEEHECICPRCKGRPSSCDVCNDTGLVYPDPRIGVVADRIISRDLLAKALALLTGEAALGADDDAIVVRAENGIAVIMRRDEDAVGLERWKE